MADENYRGRVLFGISDMMVRNLCEAYTQQKGFEYNSVSTRGGLDLAVREEGFDAILMDANFPISGGYDVSPARDVYQLVEPRVKAGQAYFMAISNFLEVVEATKALGVPAQVKGARIWGETKPGEFNLERFLSQIVQRD